MEQIEDKREASTGDYVAIIGEIAMAIAIVAEAFLFFADDDDE